MRKVPRPGWEEAVCLSEGANPETWTSDLANHREGALYLCHALCPIRTTECARLTLKHKPDHGVWSGHDYSEVPATLPDGDAETLTLVFDAHGGWKRCGACLRVKYATDFHADPVEQDGFDRLCLTCRSELAPRPLSKAERKLRVISYIESTADLTLEEAVDDLGYANSRSLLRQLTRWGRRDLIEKLQAA